MLILEKARLENEAAQQQQQQGGQQQGQLLQPPADWLKPSRKLIVNLEHIKEEPQQEQQEDNAPKSKIMELFMNKESNTFKKI
jgi:hypothetical protein